MGKKSSIDALPEKLLEIGSSNSARILGNQKDFTDIINDDAETGREQVR
jgi:hypothetical protein